MAISDTGGTLTTIATKTMPAGSWRITSEVGFGYRNPNNSWGGGADFVRCELQAGAHVIGSAQTQEITQLDYIQEIVDSATYTSSKSWTLKEACSHDQPNTVPGHYTVFSGNIVSVNQGPIG